MNKRTEKNPSKAIVFRMGKLFGAWGSMQIISPVKYLRQTVIPERIAIGEDRAHGREKVTEV